MDLPVDTARAACFDLTSVRHRMDVLHDIGLAYLTLGEETPGINRRFGRFALSFALSSSPGIVHMLLQASGSFQTSQ